jgi:hypothetical protein
LEKTANEKDNDDNGIVDGHGVARADTGTFQEKGSWTYYANLKCMMGTITDHKISIEYTPDESLRIRAADKSWKMNKHKLVGPVFVQLGNDPWVEVVAFSDNLVNNDGQFGLFDMHVMGVPAKRMTEGRVIRIKFPEESWTVKLDKDISDSFQKCANAIDTLKQK